MAKPKTNTYKALSSIWMGDGRHAAPGEPIELTVAEAKERQGAITFYFGEDDDREDVPKPAKKVRTGKPDAPVTLREDQTIVPDPAVKD